MPTLQDYWTTCAHQFGGYDRLTTTGAGSDASHFICSDVADSAADGSRYAHAWAYMLTGALAGQQRRIKETGFTGSTGDFAVTAAFTGTPQSGVQVAILSRIPVLRSGTVPGWKQLINDVLGTIQIEDTIAMTGNGLDRYTLDLATYPWMQDGDFLLGLNDPLYGSSLVPYESASPWQITRDGENVYLDVPYGAFSSGQAFGLRVRRPADSLIKRGATWTNTSGGLDDALTTDADQAVPSVTYVQAGVLAAAYRAAVVTSRDGASPENKRDADRWEAEFARLKAEAAPNLIYSAGYPRFNAGARRYSGDKGFFAS